MSPRKVCAFCNKSNGVVICHGCEQLFCTKHFMNHRQEIASKFDKFSEEHNQLRETINKQAVRQHPLAVQIDRWEKDSIERIREIANEARKKLTIHLNKSHLHLNEKLMKFRQDFIELQSSGNFTEKDFESIDERLKNLRKITEHYFDPELIIENSSGSSATRIKADEAYETGREIDSSSRIILRARTDTILLEQFVGNVELTTDRLVATQNDRFSNSTMVCLSKVFHRGTHRLCFRIEKKQNRSMLFGIIDSQEDSTLMAFRSSSLYGWMAPDTRVMKSRRMKTTQSKETFNENDQISLILSFDDATISLEHRRTGWLDRIEIDLNTCPLPWKVVVGLFSAEDSIRLL